MALDPSACTVCGGLGDYPIIDWHGRERYSIRCPECFGNGKSAPPVCDEPDDLPPRSTAASIQTHDDLLRWAASQNREAVNG